MNRSTIKRLAVLALTFFVVGCATMRSHWPFQNKSPQAAAPTSARSTPSTEQSENQKDRPKRANKKPARAVVSTQPATAPAVTPPATPAAAVPTGKTNVTLDDNDADRSRAQALLDDANARLAQINRSKLTLETSAALGQANDLASAARKAMDQHDYLAASSLARKASVLTDQVAGRTSSQ
jgi:hypothetical protein